MTPARIAAQIATHGRRIILRWAPQPPMTAWFEAEVMAHVIGLDPSDLAPASGTPQVERTIRIAQAELDRVGAPRLLTQVDRVIINGNSATLTAPPEVRYARGLPVLHVFTTLGG